MSQLPSDVAIRVHDIHKDFHLPHHQDNSIKRRIITAFEKKDKDVDVQHALRGITFDIKKGEFFGILGRNGSGKSTLLKIISQIYMPTSGYVQHRGSLVAFIELGVGFNAELTGRENVYLNAALLGFSRKETDAMYDKIVEFAELEEFMEQKLKNYSSGMKVRLAFSVAIRADADILVLDEVLAVGDAAFQRKCYNYFKSLKETHKTIVFVSHSMGAVRDYCDRAILIEDGKIAHQGSADEIADEYLKLFNKPSESSAKQPANRWGSGEARFTSVEANVTDEELTISIGVKGETADIKDVVIAINILNEKKALVTGIEAGFQKEHQFSIKKGEEKSLQYVFRNLFGGSVYIITTSLKSSDGEYIYDFWREAAIFVDTKKTSKYFPTIYPVELKELD